MVMLFDTHCHLNFGSFDNNVGDVIAEAKQNGIYRIVVPATDYDTSLKAINIAKSQDHIFAAVGIHPHHVFEFQQKQTKNPEVKFDINSEIKKIEELLTDDKVVAVGEVGLDRHIYKKTKYPSYDVEEKFIDLQKEFLRIQVELAVKHGKSLILHNREAGNDFIELMSLIHDRKLEGKTVFHCCEPDQKLLEYAKSHKFFIGVDGDIAYNKVKQEFVKSIPLDLLVLETDSPFLSPYRKFPNYPKNISYIAEFVANLLNISFENLTKITTDNANGLFNLSPGNRGG